MTPFDLSVSVTDCRLVVRSGMYLSPVQTWARCLGLTAAELLSRWDEVYAWIDPELRGEEDACQDELDEFRREFIGLPHAAQAAVVAEWEGDPWPGSPVPLGRAVRDCLDELIDRAQD